MGAGAWGCAICGVLADAGNSVTLWARESEVADEINASHRNTRFAPGMELSAAIRATSDPVEALTGATTVLLVLPSQKLRENLANWTPFIDDRATLVNLSKGIEIGTLLRMSQVIVQVTGIDSSRVAVLSGPNLASEVAQKQPSATVIACSDSGRAVSLQRALTVGYFRPYTNSDVIGVEIGGACKNVIAIACGMAAGVGLADNTAAAIITRGLAEIMRLGVAVGAQPATLAGLAGLGDLVATCMSSQSRSRSFGERLGQGDSMQSAMQAAEGRVAEGVESCQSVLALAQSYDVDMPMTEKVSRVCHHGLPVHDAIALLLGRGTGSE
ncbi:glycerol-3-phosphate dehydrogenase [Mycobacterium sp. ACS1612]|nr:glycerol-3-phosphate dehydrogenase [Mycobacterium sp. ACS1612]